MINYMSGARTGEYSRATATTGVRALLVLERFGLAKRPLRAIELAREMEVSTSTMDQLLKSLTSSGFLIFDKFRKTYWPSPRLMNFGSWLNSQCFGNFDIDQVLAAAQDATSEFCCIAVQNDCHMQVVSYTGADSWRVSDVYGMRSPVLGSIGGLARLAACENREFDWITQRAPYFLGAVPPLDEMRNRVEQARALGFASGSPHPYTNSEEMPLEDPMWCIAVPVPRALVGGAPLVLGIAGTRNRVAAHERELAQELHAVIGNVCGGHA